MDTLYIVMPAYNEEANIEFVVRQWYKILEGKNDCSRLVVADSGSFDRTHEILMRLQKELDHLEILANTDRPHGPKVIALYDYAITQGADYIFQTDSDGQTNPDEFNAFWQLRSEYDGIFGNRNARKDGISRIFVEWVVCFLIKLYFGIKVPDANAPFRLMKADVVKKYLYKLSYDFNIPNIMVTTYFVYYNERTVFKPISFRQRHSGNNSINTLKIMKIGWKALEDFKLLRREMELDEYKK